MGIPDGRKLQKKKLLTERRQVLERAAMVIETDAAPDVAKTKSIESNSELAPEKKVEPALQEDGISLYHSSLSG